MNRQDLNDKWSKGLVNFNKWINWKPTSYSKALTRNNQVRIVLELLIKLTFEIPDEVREQIKIEEERCLKELEDHPKPQSFQSLWGDIGKENV